MYDQILLPTDGSDGAKQAVEHVFDLTDTYGSLPRPLCRRSERTFRRYERRGLIDESEQMGNDVVDDLAEQAANEGLTAVGSAIHGTPHQAILESSGVIKGYTPTIDFDVAGHMCRSILA